ncbi:MAG: hypothetical protein PHN56_07010 [Candidatus Nanoarchaeia archaeon]|nr:hypothetical protein [Candidatus Nanoarchaeia archaeon]
MSIKCPVCPAELSDLLVEQKGIAPTNNNINNYLLPLANLSLFSDKGKMLYQFDEQGGIKDLDYKAIYTKTPGLKSYKSDKTLDETATKDYINKLFIKTSEFFDDLRWVKELGSYSRIQIGDMGTTENIAVKNKGLLMQCRNVSDLYKMFTPYFNNALNIIGNKKMLPSHYTAMMEKINNKDISWINDLLSLSELKSKPMENKYDFNNYLTKVLMKTFNFLDDYSKYEYSKDSLFPNRLTKSLVHTAYTGIPEKTIYELGTKDIKKFLTPEKKA